MFLTNFYFYFKLWVIIALTIVVGTLQSSLQSQGTSLKRPSLGLKPHLMIILGEQHLKLKVKWIFNKYRTDSVPSSLHTIIAPILCIFMH